MMHWSPQLKAMVRRIVRGRDGVLADGEFAVPDWDAYQMDIHRPFDPIEAPDVEHRVVRSALAALVESGILASADYDTQRFDAMRAIVRERFDVPWTAITPRVQRLIYAINAIHRPAVMVAAGIFCGNTFISNAGAAIGPGAVYKARVLVGLEIDPIEAARAERNVRAIDDSDAVRIVAADAVAFCAGFADPIDLLYLDADDANGRGKAIYVDILNAAWGKLQPGGLLLAHNSVNNASQMQDYFAFVRDPVNCRASVNVVLDGEGLEVSVR
ncbi:class I SAM-dependent methyltransferase [Ideonella sp. A 288]|uniref:class I SAM-dependent methyltransferase n=1 Tax=Ideonella sp. A 288 TaxID=1962181 RepID=UPI000B4AB6ED|nr:class I SAM-dependent methyltransferase [Ideonella sp. A 288]